MDVKAWLVEWAPCCLTGSSASKMVTGAIYGDLSLFVVRLSFALMSVSVYGVLQSDLLRGY